ncbi:MAG: hypothetical protein IJS94_02985, partial [Clostridia bacterium]|nr:hypothetical protein [Clostridia bacterium]
RAEFAQIIYKLLDRSASADEPNIPEPDDALNGMTAFFAKMVKEYPGASTIGAKTNTGVHVTVSRDAELLAEHFIDSFSIIYNTTAAAYYGDCNVWYVTSSRDHPDVKSYGMIFSTDGDLLAFCEDPDELPEIDLEEEGVTRGPIGDFSNVTVPYPLGEVGWILIDHYGRDNVYGFRYYGEYNGAHAVRVDAGAAQVITDKVVAGYYFHYNNSISIVILKNGRVYDMEYAYRCGIITKKDVAIISFINNSGRYVQAHL